MFIEPVFGKKFYGREEVLCTLQKRVKALKSGYRQNLALAGPMLAGKSSILRHFLNTLKDPDILPVYIEVVSEDFPAFCSRMSATILYQFLKSEGVKGGNNLASLKELARGRVPDTVHCVEHILRSLKAHKYDLAYEGLLGVTSVLKSETGKNCIVILDEFHNISNFQLKKPFHTFGKFIMVQKNTMYIVSSSQKTLLKEILAKKLSLLFGNFEVMEINGFDSITARSFLLEKMKDVPDHDLFADYLIQLTQGNPFYLEVIAARFGELVRAAEGSTETREVLIDALAGLLYDSGGILNQYFTTNIHFFTEKRSRKAIADVLVSMARGNRTIKAMDKGLGAKDKGLGDKLRKLQEMDVAKSCGAFYLIGDKLFEYWIRNVYSLRTGAVVDDMDIKYLEFKMLAEKDIVSFSLFKEKQLSNVLSELFCSFANHKVSLNTYERILPRFDSVEVRNVSEGIFEIIAKTGSKPWVCRAKTSGIADEQDIIADWSERISPAGTRPARRIFIPFKGIDHNAFLLAKEHGIWIWDNAQVNELLRCYGRHEIVL